MSENTVQTALDCTRPAFGDDASQRKYDAEVKAAKLKQRVRFAISPGCVVPSRTRPPLRAGEEITIADVGQSATLDLLVARGVVLRVSDAEIAAASCPADARFVVAAGRAISNRNGLATEGAMVVPADFDGGQAAIDDLVRRGAILDRGVK